MLLKALTTIAVLTQLLAFTSAKPTVYLIRHGEKPADDSNGLSAAGVERSQCLPKVFGTASAYNIGYIMAQTYEEDGSRKRPYDTVKPLADSLGLTVDIGCDRDDPDCVQKRVENYNGKGNILICWEHKKLTDIVKALGDKDAPKYPSDHFDLIWTDPAEYTGITSQTSECCPGDKC